MSTENHTSTPGSKSRRKVLIAAVLAAVALLSTGAVAYWSGDSWSDEAMSSSGFPGLPGGDWTSTTSDDGWGSADTSTAATGTPTAATGTPTAATGTTRPGTTRAPATAVVEPASDPTSAVPTTSAPAPSSSRATPPPAPTSTVAPSPSSTPTRGNPNPKPKPTKKPTPTPTPSPTSSDGGCFLLIIC